MHLNILRPEDWQVADFKVACDVLNHHILSVVQNFRGSVSAEHGIGLLKKDFLRYSRSGPEIKLLRGVKNVFDPNSIMNPGKLL